MALSNIEIVQAATLKPILQLAQQRLGIPAQALEPYGHHKAKIDLAWLNQQTGPNGKLVLVTETNISVYTSVRAKIAKLQQDGFGQQPVCVAKTQCSFSHNGVLPCRHGCNGQGRRHSNSPAYSQNQKT